MNSFANTMFAMLFGGIRSVIQRVWGAAAEGRLSGFFTWLGDHWLWVALFLCIACTAVDFLVWVIRWRPYLVWKTWLRKLRRLFRGERKREKMFERGYREALVPVHIAEGPAPAAPRTDWPEEQWEEQQEIPAPQTPEEYPVYPQPAGQPAPEADVPAVQFEMPAYPAQEPAAVFSAPQPENPAPRGRAFPPPTAYEAPPMELPERPASVYGAEPSYASRRRRSERHEKKRGEWQKRLAAITQDDVGMLDGLPPAVDRQDAFHEPVYPHQPGADGGQGPSWAVSGRQQGGGA